ESRSSAIVCSLPTEPAAGSRCSTSRATPWAVSAATARAPGSFAWPTPSAPIPTARSTWPTRSSVACRSSSRSEFEQETNRKETSIGCLWFLCCLLFSFLGFSGFSPGIEAQQHHAGQHRAHGDVREASAARKPEQAARPGLRPGQVFVGERHVD